MVFFFTLPFPSLVTIISTSYSTPWKKIHHITKILMNLDSAFADTVYSIHCPCPAMFYFFLRREGPFIFDATQIFVLCTICIISMTHFLLMWLNFALGTSFVALMNLLSTLLLCSFILFHLLITTWILVSEY